MKEINQNTTPPPENLIVDRKEFLQLTWIGLMGLIIPKDLMTAAENMFASENPTDEEIIANMPKLEDEILMRIVDDNNSISREEIEEDIEPRLIAEEDLDPRATRFGPLMVSEHIRIHELMKDDLERMWGDSSTHDTDPRIYLRSGYRSYQDQRVAFNRVRRNENLVKPPGKSQHHLGLAVDVTSPRIDKAVGIYAGFENTPEYAWLQTHSHEYGFVQSYEENHDGVDSEPWHYLYVGVEMATYYRSLRDRDWSGDIFRLQELYKLS